MSRDNKGLMTVHRGRPFGMELLATSKNLNSIFEWWLVNILAFVVPPLASSVESFEKGVRRNH
jgi:hypothetical protein